MIIIVIIIIVITLFTHFTLHRSKVKSYHFAIKNKYLKIYMQINRMQTRLLGCCHEGRPTLQGHVLLPRCCFCQSRWHSPLIRSSCTTTHLPPLLLVTVCWPVEPPGQMATRTAHYHFADVFPRNVFFNVSVVLLEHYKSVKGPFLKLYSVQDASAC